MRQALKLAAMSLSRSSSALGAFYRRLCARMGKPRANTAVAHKLARMIYFMLTCGEAFVDPGQQHYEEQQRQRSSAERPTWALRTPHTPHPPRLEALHGICFSGAPSGPADRQAAPVGRSSSGAACIHVRAHWAGWAHHIPPIG